MYLLPDECILMIDSAVPLGIYTYRKAPRRSNYAQVRVFAYSTISNTMNFNSARLRLREM